MIDLDVDFDFLGQAVALQEGEHRRGVAIILMLGGFKRLGFDQYRPLEADAVFVLDDHGQEAAVLVELASQIGIQQRVITLTSAP